MLYSDSFSIQFSVVGGILFTIKAWGSPPAEWVPYHISSVFFFVHGLFNFSNQLHEETSFIFGLFSGDEDLVHCPRTRTVLPVTSFFVPDDFGSLFSKIGRHRWQVENKVQTAKNCQTRKCCLMGMGFSQRQQDCSVRWKERYSEVRNQVVQAVESFELEFAD